MKRILLPIDFSEATEPAVAFVQELAGQTGAQVYVLHVTGSQLKYERGKSMPPEPELSDLCARMKDSGCDAHPLSITGLKAEADIILEQIHSLGADLVVMGSHGHSAVHNLILGSVSTKVLRYSERPVLIVPSPRPEPIDPPADAHYSSWGEAGFPPI